MSAFGGESRHDRLWMSAFAVALGVKRTPLVAANMCACDPKRTLCGTFPAAGLSRYDALSGAAGVALRRRDKAGGKAVKARRRKTVMRGNVRLKRRAANPYEKIALLEHRLNDALEQQRASAEVLNVISNSVSKAEPVF